MTATLRTTESLPRGRAADRLLDLGTGTVDPRYPLVRDESGTGRRALTGLDTCVLAGDRGPFGSIPRRIGDRDAPRSVPTSWPMAKLTVRSLGEVALGGGEPAELQQLSWDTDAGAMTAVIYRPADGSAPVVSPADRASPLQAYQLPVPASRWWCSVGGPPGTAPVSARRAPPCWSNAPAWWSSPPRPAPRPTASPTPTKPTTAP